MVEPNLPPNHSFLPGLELGGEDFRGHGDLWHAVAATLRALDAQGLLEARHAGVAQLALTMAEAVEAGVHSRRASAAAMASAQLLAALQALPEPREVTAAEDLARFREELRGL